MRGVKWLWQEGKFFFGERVPGFWQEEEKLGFGSLPFMFEDRAFLPQSQDHMAGGSMVILRGGLAETRTGVWKGTRVVTRKVRRRLVQSFPVHPIMR